MSFWVLVIPEDFIKDEGILKPIVSAILTSAGKSNARVEVCHNPRLGGVRQALRRERIAEVVSMYPMVDLFMLCVDRDGLPGRKEQLDKIEVDVHDRNRRLIAENAWQEVEVWVLAGLTNLPSEWSWQDIRDEVSLKETYYLPVARQEGLDMEPDEGRGRLARRAAANYKRIKQLCPEDIGALESRIEALYRN